MFKNRAEAGKLLAEPLNKYKRQKNTYVLGLARGGMVVAFELAKSLLLPLHVIIPRKIGSPHNKELAIGAIMESGEEVLNDDIISMLKVPRAYIDKEIAKEKVVIRERLALYQQHSSFPDLTNQTVILVDDGIATGATMRVAIKAMRSRHVVKVIVAVPVAATDSLIWLQKLSDKVVCLYDRQDFYGVGAYYENFSQVEDDQIIQLLDIASKGFS